MEQKHEITICLGSSCFSRGGKEVLNTVRGWLKEHNMEESVFFHGDLCMGICEMGPTIKINGREFHNVNKESVVDFLNKELGDGSEK